MLLVLFMWVIQLLLTIAMFDIRNCHPNFVILAHIVKHAFVNNTNDVFQLSLDCASCKLGGKSKSWPLRRHSSCGSVYFEIIHIVVQGVWVNTCTLWHLLIIIVVSFWSIFFVLMLMCYLHFKLFLLIHKLNFLHVLRSYFMILVRNICLGFSFFSITDGYFLLSFMSLHDLK